MLSSRCTVGKEEIGSDGCHPSDNDLIQSNRRMMQANLRRVHSSLLINI